MSVFCKPTTCLSTKPRVLQENIFKLIALLIISTLKDEEEIIYFNNNDFLFVILMQFLGFLSTMYHVIGKTIFISDFIIQK